METVRSYVSSSKSIPKTSPDKELVEILGQVRGSHEGIFVIGETGDFQGVIWLYNVLFHRRPKRTSLVRQHTVMPPELTMNSGIFDAVNAMLDLRLYTLPVFDGDRKVIGVITAKEMLRRMLKNGTFTEIQTAITPSKPFIASKDEKLRSIYSRMRRHGRSRAVTVDEDEQLVGLVSRRNIYAAMILPTVKSRMKSDPRRTGQLLFDKEWPMKLDQKLKQMTTFDVVTSLSSHDMRSVFEQMLERDVNSTVIVDAENKPEAMVSIRSFLKAVADTEKHSVIPIDIVDEKSTLSVFRRIEMQDVLWGFAAKMKDRHVLSKLTLIIDSRKNAKDKVSSYEVSLYADTGPGSRLYAKEKDHDLRPAVKSAIAKIQRQLH